MTGKQPKNRRGMSEGSRATQIKPGQRLPGAGRPKGSPNRHAIIRKVLGQVIGGQVDGKFKKMNITEASLLKLANQAVAGDLKAIRMVLELWKESEDGYAREKEAQYQLSDADRQVIDAMYHRMRSAEEAGGER